MPNNVTITGRLGDDVELRFTPQGKAVANLRVADTPRRLNQQTNQWEDAGETLWINVSIWEAKAEAIAAAAHKGDLVTVVGTLVSRSWDAQDGTKRTVIEVKASEIAVVPRASRQGGQQAQQRQQQPAQGGWNQDTGAGGWGQPATQEPPF
jgi:single-strand DNA-binding protein